MLSNITLEELIKEAYKTYTKKLNKKVRSASNRPLKNKKKLRKIQKRNKTIDNIKQDDTLWQKFRLWCVLNLGI